MPVIPSKIHSRLLVGDCREKLRGIPPSTFTAVVTDPPYGLKFMGKEWDHGIPGQEFWEAIARVCKPGAFLLAFGGTRTFHRLACAIEDAGWELRDTIMWVYGSGFPKSHDISKAIDKAAGVEREVVGFSQQQQQRTPGIGTNSFGDYKGQTGDITAPATPLAQLWDGWGTALKPAWEPIVIAMKPLDGTFAQNAEKHGVAGLNVDECRIDAEPRSFSGTPNRHGGQFAGGGEKGEIRPDWHETRGRWPANLIHDGSDEVLEGFPSPHGAGHQTDGDHCHGKDGESMFFGRSNTARPRFGDSGSASRFFYCAKASKSERTSNGQVENKHPTVKPLKLMEYLVKLVTMPRDTYILDPFCGSGSTLLACKRLGVKYVGIDDDVESIKTAARRLRHEHSSKE